MKIEIDEDQEICKIRLSGDVMWNQYIELIRHVLRRAVTCDRVTLDISRATSVGSAFINMLVRFRNEYPMLAARVVLIAAAKEFPLDILRTTHLTDLYPVVAEVSP